MLRIGVLLAICIYSVSGSGSVGSPHGGDSHGSGSKESGGSSHGAPGPKPCSEKAGQKCDHENDVSNIPAARGFAPCGIRNEDGWLRMIAEYCTCDEIRKEKPVCSENYIEGTCPPFNWVGGIKRVFTGADDKVKYLQKCCYHPIMKNVVSVRPVPDFWPGLIYVDAGLCKANVIDILTDIGPNPAFDHHMVVFTTVQCTRTSTSTSTQTPPTDRPRNSQENNQDPNHAGSNAANAANAAGAHGSNPDHSGSNHGGGSDGGNHGDGSNGHANPRGPHDCNGGSHGQVGGGANGCGNTPHPRDNDQIQMVGLSGGEHPEYHPVQNLPRPQPPPQSAYDPHSWGASGGAACFSADTLVQTRRGDKRMDEIQVGDEVLSSISWDGNSAVSYQPITQFIHKDSSVATKYTIVSTESGRVLSISPYHLLPQFECQLLEGDSISHRDYEILFTESARFAKKARPGQCLLVVDMSGRFVADRISNVTTQIRQGVFSPITASGIIVANGVQASCYSTVENHALQHAFFTFMHKITQTCQPYIDYARQLITGTKAAQIQDDGQVPVLLRVMLILSEMVVGSF